MQSLNISFQTITQRDCQRSSCQRRRASRASRDPARERLLRRDPARIGALFTRNPTSQFDLMFLELDIQEPALLFRTYYRFYEVLLGQTGLVGEVWRH